MKIATRGRWIVPKSTGDACEDHAAVSPDNRAFAVSDGASHSLYAGHWARCLVDRFVEQAVEAPDAAWLEPAARRFYGAIDLASLPWHALNKLAEGTFATLCAVAIGDARQAGFVVGDSCLVRWEPDREPVFFPDCGTDDLALDPYLLGTIASSNETALARIRRFGPDPLLPGRTRYLLFTDAVARWVLGRDLRDAATTLLACETEASFEAWVRGARDAGTLQDDDCTLLVLEIDAEDG